MGTNERKYAWMDEGWASFFPIDILDRYEPEYDYLQKIISSYEESAGFEAEIPLMVPSYSYRGRYVRTGFYDRPAAAYNELQNLLGAPLFKKALLEYINRWHGKHPIPLDFFYTFNNVCGEDLSWFLKPWFYEFGYPDLEISNVQQKNGYVTVKVKKVGSIPTRISLTLQFDDGTNEVVDKSSRVWGGGESETVIKINTSQKLHNVLLGNNHIPDVNKKNNTYNID
jgi:aminopeptidase N